MKAFASAVLTCALWTTAALAAQINVLPIGGPVLRVDWQEPLQLPPRFRNHCTFEKFTERPYCSDHCGLDYQFYYCSEASFGCCHLGRGHCDFNGLLRCHP